MDAAVSGASEDVTDNSFPPLLPTMSDHDHSENETAHAEGGCDHDHANPWPTRSLIVAAAFNVAALALQWSNTGGETLPKILAAVAIGFGGWFILPSAWAAVRRLRPNINLLMVIAVTGAAFIGEWAEAATVVVLFGVAEWLEGWADRRARPRTKPRV